MRAEGTQQQRMYGVHCRVVALRRPKSAPLCKGGWQLCWLGDCLQGCPWGQITASCFMFRIANPSVTFGATSLTIKEAFLSLRSRWRFVNRRYVHRCLWLVIYRRYRQITFTSFSPKISAKNLHLNVTNLMCLLFYLLCVRVIINHHIFYEVNYEKII